MNNWTLWNRFRRKFGNEILKIRQRNSKALVQVDFLRLIYEGPHKIRLSEKEGPYVPLLTEKNNIFCKGLKLRVVDQHSFDGYAYSSDVGT